MRLDNEVEDAEHEAREIHGKRPDRSILWRHYDVFDEEHLDLRREEFLEQPGADHKQVEKEYLEGKARLAAAAHAFAEWDKRAGIAPLRRQSERAEVAATRAALRMARTKPTTPAGAGALLSYLHRDVGISLGSLAAWHMPAIRTVAIALIRMEART